MSEKYSGVKFKTIFKEKRRIKEERIERLKFWGKKFADLNLAPKIEGGFAGNLSFRTEHGFIITPSGANLSELKDDDFVEVVDVDDRKQILVCGLKNPSSESLLHYAIYNKRKDIKAVFHGHDKLVLKFNNMLNFPITEKEQPYGSKELVDEVIKILNKNSNYLLLKNHGFISLGKTMDEAGRNAIEKHEKALGLNKKTIYDLSEDEFRHIFEKVRWKNGVICPYCKSKNIVKNGHVNGYQNYICKNCNHSFTSRTGTVFSHSKIPLKMWIIAAISLDKDSIISIAEKLGLYYHTAYDLVKKVRKSALLNEMMENLPENLNQKI